MKRPVSARMDENPEWTSTEVAAALNFASLPKGLRSNLSKRKRGPQKSPTKERISIRISRDVLKRFRAMGDGWQKQVDAALKEWLSSNA